MPVYDFTDDYDCRRAESYLQTLIRRKADKVELTDRHKRTSPQNRYLHVCIGIVAMETGNPLEYVKEKYFKRLVNASLFVENRFDSITGRNEETVRSSSVLTVEEMTTAIERFRNWASAHGWYIPSPEEEMLLRQAEAAIRQSDKFL